MACDFRTFSVLQGSFLFPVLLSISLFSGIYSQTSLPSNPQLAGDYEKNEGETVTLSCSVIGGNPLPWVQWYKNQQLVDPGSSSSGNGDGIYTVGLFTVIYNNYTFTVSRSDNLVSYICKVQNSLMASPLEIAWTISIYVPSEEPFISGTDPAITTALNSGSTYKYICTAQNGRPVPNLRWKLGTSLSSAVEFHQGITENTSTNADSTLSKSSTLSWVPIVDDNGKNLYCQTDQTTAGAGTIQKSTSVPIVVQLCMPGWYGKDCSRRCSKSCLNASCDVTNGTCLFGHTLSLPHHDDGIPIAVVVGVTLGTLLVIIIVIGTVVIARRRCRQEAGDQQVPNPRDVINTRGDVHEHVYEKLSFANNHI